MKNIILSLLFSTFSFLHYAQTDVDEAFNDGTKYSLVNLGVNLFTLGTGTVHITNDLRITKSLYLTTGVGIMPFGSIVDAIDVSTFFSNTPIIESSINDGRYVNLGVKIFPTRANKQTYDIKGYYTLGYSRWQYNKIGNSNSRNKFYFGGGYRYFTSSKWIIDTGYSLAFFSRSYVKEPSNAYPFGESKTARSFGFKLSLTVSYQLF